MSGLTATPPLGRAARGGWARGAMLGSRPSVRHPTRSPRPSRHAPLPSRASARAKVWRLFARQGGLLSIATQELNWSRSPLLLGPSWSPVGPMAVEVCAGPGSADVEHSFILANSPYKLFARQGGLLSIATQEPNWSRSPSPLGLVLAIRTTQRRLWHARGRALPTQNIKACLPTFS